MSTCRPWWVAKFVQLDDSPRLFIPGCATILAPEDPNFGFNMCAPEKLRAAAQTKLGLLGFPVEVTLDAYSLARNIAAEQGSGTPEMKLALAYSTMGRAKLKGKTVSQVILANGRCPDGKTGNGCRYGRIHGASGIDTAPFSRFTASSQDPTVEDVAIAVFALSEQVGEAGSPTNPAGGADDQWGPETVDRALAKMRSYAKSRNYWVGRLPGVHPLALHLFRRRPEITPGSREDTILQGQLEAELRQNLAELDVIKTPDGYKSLTPCIESAPGKNVPAGGVVAAAGLAALGAGVVAVTVLGYFDRQNLAFLGRLFRR